MQGRLACFPNKSGARMKTPMAVPKLGKVPFGDPERRQQEEFRNMKGRITLLICAALLLSMVCTAFAATEGGFAGKSEINFAAAWVHVAGESVTLGGVNYGKFFTPNVEGQIGVLYAKISGIDSMYAIAPAVSYSFVSPTTTNIVPYVGAGWAFFRAFGNSDNSFEAFAGGKFFLGGDYKTSKSAVFLEYRYINDIAGEKVNTVWTGISTMF
jgi:hypothetical protein